MSLAPPDKGRLAFLTSLFFLVMTISFSDVFAQWNNSKIKQPPTAVERKGELLERQAVRPKSKWKKNKWKHPEERDPYPDRPDLAWEQEFRLTKDPALNIVPRERLIPIMEDINARKTMRGPQPYAGVVSTATWVERGPVNVAGRTRAIMFDPNDATKKKVWAGGVGGGLWWTDDVTLPSPTWINVSDLWSNMAVTAIAHNPANTQQFYVGTGEGWGNLDAIRGAGIFKTTNGGATWTALASTTSNTNFDYINKIVVTSSGIVFAATSSRFCNAGGIYKSTDGGTTWTLSFGVQGSTCAGSNCSGADIEIGSDGTLYASTGIFYTGGIYKSTDNGTTWTQINTGTNGFPTSGFQRIEIAVAPSDANRLYAMTQDENTYGLFNIYTSANKGSTWTTCTKPSWVDQSCSSPSTDMTREQAWYDLILTVDPLVATTVIAGGIDLMKSTNTGSSWTQLSSWCTCCSRQYVHADQHAILYRPGSSTVAVVANDGGVYYSSNMTAAIPTFSQRNYGYNVTQFYSCAIHPTAGQNNFLAGAQDNGTQKFTTSFQNSTTEVTGGDGAFCFIDQTNGNYQIASYVYNNYYRTTNNWSTSSTISSSSTTGDFINPADYDDVNNILYSSYSTTQLQRISGLESATPSSPVQFTVTGMTAMASHIRVSPYATAGTTTLFVGTQNAKLYKITNAQGAAPISTSIGSTAFPADASISCVEIGATESDLLVTFYNYGVTSVWRTTNGGTTWTSKEGNLPDMPIRWAVYNPNDRNEVLLATETGVWSTADITVISPVWVPNNNGLANVRVDMLQYRNSDKEMIAATHGRGLYSTNVFGTPQVADFTGTPLTACTGKDVTFTSTSTGAITTYSWNFGSGATPATSTSSGPVTVQYSTTGSKTVTLTVTGPSGSNTMTKTAYINVVSGVGTVGTVTGPATVCSGQTGRTYSVNSVTGATSYTWSVPSGFTITSGQGTSSIQVTPGSANGNISVTAGNGTCTSASPNLAVVVSTGLAQPVISPSGTVQYCTGDALQLTAAQPTLSCGPATTSVCNGSPVNASVGTGALSGSSSAFPSPFANNYETTRQQFLYRGSELQAAGLRAGTIRSVSFDVSGLNTAGTLREYTIRLLCTPATSITTFTAGAQTVYGPTTYTPVTGVNTLQFSNLFNWDGSSNLIVEICHNNDLGSTTTEWTSNVSARYTTTSYGSCVIRNIDNIGSQCTSTTVTQTSTNRPNIVFAGCGGSTLPSYMWTGGATTATINIAAAGNYTLTATNSSGCTSTASKTVDPKPASAAALQLFIEGFYQFAGQMNPLLYTSGLSTDSTHCDSVMVELRQPTGTLPLIHSKKALLKTNGNVQCSFPCTALNQSYYIVIRSRNGVETWSKQPVIFSPITSYTFD